MNIQTKPEEHAVQFVEQHLKQDDLLRTLAQYVEIAREYHQNPAHYRNADVSDCLDRICCILLELDGRGTYHERAAKE